MKNKFALLAISTLAAVFTSANVKAATSTTQFRAVINITSACNVSATNMDFLTQGTLATAIDVTSMITVTCTNLVAYNVGIDGGSMGANISNRKMKISAAGLEAVSYSLFRNSTRTLNWGNTIGSDTYPGIGTGVAQNIPVYGRVPSQATVTAGTYYDVLTVTLSY